MYFSEMIKRECLEVALDGDCCAIAFLNGLFHSSGELAFKNKQFSVEVYYEIDAVFDFVKDIIKRLYGVSVSKERADDYSINKKNYYKIIFPIDRSEQILLDTGIVERGEVGGLTFVSKMPDFILNSECCKRAFIKGAFVGAGTTNIKLSEKAYEKTSSGYHLEFASHNYEFLSNLASVLCEKSIIAKTIKRKNTFVLYIKEASQISDLLAIINANECVLKLQNEIISREMRNKINRETNCFSANINKTVEASLKQIAAIEIINDTIGLASLPPDLEEVALMRLANQEESLEELLALTEIKITKSGLNHRFRKLIKIANELKK